MYNGSFGGSISVVQLIRLRFLRLPGDKHHPTMEGRARTLDRRSSISGPKTTSEHLISAFSQAVTLGREGTRTLSGPGTGPRICQTAPRQIGRKARAHSPECFRQRRTPAPHAKILHESARWRHPQRPVRLVHCDSWARVSRSGGWSVS